jgi:hypothetical protein
LEVSAKSGERVDESFLRISEKILRRIKENDLNPDGDSVIHKKLSQWGSDEGKRN